MTAKISALILQFWEEGIPVAIINDAQGFLAQNEWGVAFDLLVDYVVENNIPISRKLYAMIVEAGEGMQLSQSEYELAKGLVR